MIYLYLSFEPDFVSILNEKLFIEDLGGFSIGICWEKMGQKLTFDTFGLAYTLSFNLIHIVHQY